MENDNRPSSDYLTLGLFLDIVKYQEWAIRIKTRARLNSSFGLSSDINAFSIDNITCQSRYR